MLNLEQARALFRQHAILFGATDGVALGKAMELLGDEAARFVCDHPVEDGYRRIVYANCFCLGDGKPKCAYLTLEGFLRGVSYNNVMGAIDERERRHKNQKSRGRNGIVIPFDARKA